MKKTGGKSLELTDKKTPRPGADPGSGEAPDKATIESSKEIFHVLANTVTAMKLYPSHHATVTKFMDDLYAKLRTFFENRQELDVDIQENAFLLGGETVFKDTELIKSLPYLFHKDGMEKLAILKEIDKIELRSFLEVVRLTALQPLDESDIVMAIWERDFANIRIYAPDDYLLAKIDVFMKQPFDIFIDRKKLFSGQIELSADDLKDIQSKSVSLGLIELEEKKDYAELMTMLDDQDIHRIDSMLTGARQVPPEKEFLDMIFELLYLEERIEQFALVLGYLERHNRELLQDSKYLHAAQFVKQIQELKNLFSSRDPAKEDELEKFLIAIQDARTIALIRDSIERKNIDSLSSFFEYLKFLGSKSIPLAAELLGEDQDPEYRRVAQAYLEDIGRNNVEILANQLQDSKPALSMELIKVLGRISNKKVLTYFAPLHTYVSKDIKLAGIETLSSFPDLLAQRIILGFLQDEDEDVRSTAADKLRPLENKEMLKRVIRMISVRRFHEKSTREKLAFLNILARTKTPEALAALRRAMSKSSLLARASSSNTRVCAVYALGATGTPEAISFLEKGLKSSNREVSEACRKLLEKKTR